MAEIASSRSAQTATHAARRAQLWLGTLVDISAEGTRTDVLEAGIAAAFCAIERVHCALSGHDRDSELSRINREAHRKRVPVSSDMRAVLACALDVARRSHGAFDPTVGGELVTLGFLPRHRSTRGGRAGAWANSSWHDVDLDSDGVRYRRALTLDFDGIAKGHAVDCAIDAMRRQGIEAACVNAGGDLRVFGTDPLPIHVRTGGSRAALVPLVSLADGAVATSAYGDRRRYVNGRWIAPLIDPRRRLPMMSTRTVSVIAPTCMVADALTKVVTLRGRAAEGILEHYGAAAAIFSPAGERWRCTRLPAPPKATVATPGAAGLLAVSRSSASWRADPAAR
jgi:FAD:protein FMN transferase